MNRFSLEFRTETDLLRFESAKVWPVVKIEIDLISQVEVDFGLVDETGSRSRRNVELVDGVVSLLHDVVVVIVG